MKLMRALARHGLVGWLFAPVLAGCGSPFGADVEGFVRQDGTPLSQGTVMYHPVAGGTPAYASIQTDGSYRIRTGREDGLTPGEYIVTVVAREPNVVLTEGGGPPVPGRLLTPQKYSNRQSSDLRITVARGRNEIPLDLVSP